MNKKTISVIEAITADILNLSQTILNESRVGVNPKTGSNTLKDSALSRNVQVRICSMAEPVVIEVMFDNYINYIEQGRKPRSGRQPPIHALRDWALSRGIPADNSTLFLISRAIWRDGQAPRPVLATLGEEIDKLFEDKWAGQLLDIMTEELIKYFK